MTETMITPKDLFSILLIVIPNKELTWDIPNHNEFNPKDGYGVVFNPDSNAAVFAAPSSEAEADEAMNRILETLNKFHEAGHSLFNAVINDEDSSLNVVPVRWFPNGEFAAAMAFAREQNVDEVFDFEARQTLEIQEVSL